MTELEKLCEQALYEEIQDLGDGKSIVRDVASGRLFYRKVLTVYNIQVFAYLKEHKSRYVPRVESFREDEDTLIVIEEFVQGRTLAEILDDEDDPLSFRERIRILSELCDGLSFLHDAQPPIIHRDLKASNVMLTEDGVVKIIDYDAAKIYVSGEKKDTVLMGTHGVAAPEQYGFAASDVRTDIFALGKLMERMLPENVDAARIVARATHIDPKKRYSSAAQIKEQIVRIREHASSLDTRLEKVIPGYDPRQKRHRLLGRAAIALLCAAILLGAGFAVWRFAVYPEQRREAMLAELKTIESEDASGEKYAADIEGFLQRYPYEKMSAEEQSAFRDSMEKLLSGHLKTEGIRDPILSVLTDRCGQEAADTVLQYAEVEQLLSSGAFAKAFDALRPLKESADADAQDKWNQTLKRCQKKAADAEKTYREEGYTGNLERAFELYALLISAGDQTLAGEAEQAYDDLFEDLLSEGDAASEAGEYDQAGSRYLMLQKFQATEKTRQTNLEDRIKDNTYREAESRFAEEKYTVAQELFSEIEGYRDASDRVLQCQYLKAEDYMGQQNYSAAAKAYELCPGYEDADEKLIEAKYRHCASVSEKPDDDAYTWITELVAAGYPGAQDVQNTMYQWHAEIKNEVSLIVGSQQSVHIRAYLYGGRPDASTHIRFETIDNVTGAKSSWTSPETTSRDGHDDAGYSINTFEYSLFEREHTVNVYSDDGKMIGTWTGIFSKEFTID